MIEYLKIDKKYWMEVLDHLADYAEVQEERGDIKAREIYDDLVGLQEDAEVIEEEVKISKIRDVISDREWYSTEREVE